VIFKRPGSGITVDKWETIRGKKAKHSLSKGSFLRMKDLT
jgi:sialic acid synthase SpsE